MNTVSYSEFMAKNNSRLTCGNSWMCVTDEGKEKDYLYTVYNREYGKRKTIILYEGHYLSTALQFLSGEIK